MMTLLLRRCVTGCLLLLPLLAMAEPTDSAIEADITPVTTEAVVATATETTAVSTLTAAVPTVIQQITGDKPRKKVDLGLCDGS